MTEIRSPSNRFIAFARMEERVSRALQNSDSEYFDSIMYYGEFLCKLLVAGLLASIQDDPDRNRYRHIHRLVRADGIGDWSDTLRQVTSGPASQFIIPQAKAELVALTQKHSAGQWQHDAVARLQEAIATCVPDYIPATNGRLHLLEFFGSFAHLRNKTRGHGAPLSETMKMVAPPLRAALDQLVTNYPLFARPWAHVRQNLSGKYRVTYLTDSSSEFENLKKDSESTLPDGLYIDYAGKLCLVELISTNADLTDIYCANGAFRDRPPKYEMLSYITGDIRAQDASGYMAPPTALPAAETQGIGELGEQGQCFGNLPKKPSTYIDRPVLQKRISALLQDEHHTIITLHGPGGIGKTSLALVACHELSHTGRFDVIVWFSSRDIDLLPTGPKAVRPHVVNEKDMAKEYIKLLQPSQSTDKPFDAVKYFATQLSKSAEGPTLFVFDNFETVLSPADLFEWIDTHIRPPNKVMITTRFRDFNGDYHIEVIGMEEPESRELMTSIAKRFGVHHLLTDEYMATAHQITNGHPYVLKILLGEVATEKRLVSPKHILADRERVLTALFERGYSRLSPGARRVFLTLCRWRSLVPRTALKAVLLRPKNDQFDVDRALDELERGALVEVSQDFERTEEFLSVPLAAALFGSQKLAADPFRSAVEADFEILRLFGAAQGSDVERGLAPRARRIFQAVARRVAKDSDDLDDYVPVLEFVASSFTEGWLLLADLYEEADPPDATSRALAAVRKYLETETADQRHIAWERVARLCQKRGDIHGEVHAWSELAEAADSIADISRSANRINSLLASSGIDLEWEEKQVLLRRIIAAFVRNLEFADVVDLSRLAWLHLHLGEAEQARHYVKQALASDYKNEHVSRLAKRLNII